VSLFLCKGWEGKRRERREGGREGGREGRGLYDYILPIWKRVEGEREGGRAAIERPCRSYFYKHQGQEKEEGAVAAVAAAAAAAATAKEQFPNHTHIHTHTQMHPHVIAHITFSSNSSSQRLPTRSALKSHVLNCREEECKRPSLKMKGR